MPSEALAKEGCSLHYVYLIRSISTPSERYVGVTADLKRRIKQHNASAEGHTTKFQPWQLVAYVAFSDARRAADFEKYLKQGSGHAFANRHLW